MGVAILAAAGIGVANEAGAAGENRTASASKTSGLNPDGETVTVTGSGFDPAKGIYVALCVDNGAGQLATPCLGGVDMEGAGGSSAWISSNPPAYGEGLAEPYGADGSFSVSLRVTAADDFADCRTAANGCAIFVRADHTRSADRSQDFRIPVSFASGSGASDDASSSDDDAESGANRGPLPTTGANALAIALIGLLALGAGTALVAAARRRNARGPVAALAVVALAGGAFVAAPAPDASAVTTVQADDVTSGTLSWGVRTSFRNYVTGPIAHGDITTDGAASYDGAQFHFPDATGELDAESGAVSVAFSGSVQFTGHDYGNGSLLDITLSNLRVIADDATGTVVADIDSRPFQGIDPDAPAPPVEHHADVELVTLDFTGQDLTPTEDGTVTVTDAPATLTEEGSAAFAGFYPAGDPFDPVSFTVVVESVPDIEAPVVTTHPASLTVDEGADAEFAAAASGTPEPAVHWEVSSDGATWEPLDGETSSTLTLSSVSSELDGHDYRAVFSNEAGTATSDPAMLTVIEAEPSPVSVTVEPTTELPAQNAEVTVTGSGFSTEGSGVYVAVGPQDVAEHPDWFSNADYFTGVEWVRTDGIGDDGTFTAMLEFDAAFESGGEPVDCTETECGVYTFAAHGSDDRSQDTYTPLRFASDEEPTWEPSLQLLDEAGDELDQIPADGATVTVRGEGFDPDANTSTRPPVTPGEPTGVYVVFGDFAAEWKPSDGAPSSDRTVIDQMWALPADSLDQVATDFPSQADQLVELTEDGTFETTLEIAPVDAASGVLGVYTYAAGGAAPNPDQELAVPVVFANAGEPELAVQPSTDLANGDDVEVTGTGFAPGRWLYVAITPQGSSGETNPSPFSSSKRVRTDPAGEFTVTVENLQAQFTNENVDVDCLDVECYVASFSSPLEADNELVDLSGDRSLDVFVPITFAADPGPDPDPDPEEPGAVEEGVLDWGIKESFRTYITGSIAHGQIETSDGASANADGTFRFVDADGTVDADNEAAELSFAGTVRFTGHDSGDGPLLEFILADPVLVVEGDAGVLSADVTSRSLDDGELVEYPDVEFAELDLSGVSWDVGDDEVWAVTEVPATLTAEAVPAFADFYEARDDLDPVSFTVGTSDVPEPGNDDDPDDGSDGDDSGASSGGSTVKPASASTGSGLPKTGAEWALTAAAGLGLVGAGTGVTLAVRRRRLAVMSQ